MTDFAAEAVALDLSSKVYADAASEIAKHLHRTHGQPYPEATVKAAGMMIACALTVLLSLAPTHGPMAVRAHLTAAEDRRAGRKDREGQNMDRLRRALDRVLAEGVDRQVRGEV